MTVSDIDAFYNKIKSQKLNFFKDIIVSKYRKDTKTIIQKEFLIQDLDGHLLRFTS